ncbi:unnamed protein product [marine sediment metagenome]|uniref:Uncharacterized protein n=1 Tax=marine sediment metagenome TaxID=412755 RepID=X0Z5C6_9ZZZZ
MSHTVARCYPKKMYTWGKENVLEIKCRVFENNDWLRTVRVRVPFPLYFEELTHLLMEHLDVGNIEFQQHMEYHIPHEWPESIN